ncbi:MAG: TldD/PmbA family protein [Candidatus Cloacimonadota bacterium]|nr:TldD/PmbA family protein [Candidatus Cloacimonadota bacterium]
MFEKEFEQIFDIAKKRNIKDIDILLTKANSFSVKIFKQEVESFKYADSIGLGVRVLKNNSVGYAYTEKLNKNAFETIINKAQENATYIESDEEVELKNYPDIKRKLYVYYPELEKVTVSEKINKAKLLEESARKFSKKIINVPYSEIGNAKGSTKIANSNGLQKAYISNMAYGYAMSLARQKDETKSGMFYKFSHDFNQIDAEIIGNESAKRALDLLEAREIKSGKYPIIFNNEMAATVLDTFCGIFSAKSVQEGSSLLKGKLNTKIANNIVSIIDDALLDIGFSTRPFDDEGYPSQTTNLISKGILQSYLHNTITAKKDKTKSTGNASRSYKSTMNVSPSNLFIPNSKTPSDDLYKFFTRSIEIVQLSGMHSGCNPISGDFSMGAQGFFWENGERKYPVHNFTISGNFLQLLQDIIAIGDNLKFNFSSIGAPSILVEKLNISG